MTEYYYLGANSSRGFYSLYNSFPNADDTMLHVIKGGPGTGKSTLMRKIGAAAEKKGMDAEYVICSGDPLSLDGVYVPALKQAWVDGTAPHIIEPGCFGLNGDYINLGVFCRNDFNDEEKRELRLLSDRHKKNYAAVYNLLAAAETAAEAASVRTLSPETDEKIRERIFSACNKNISERSGVRGKAVFRFYSSISYNGYITPPPELYGGFKQIIKTDSSVGAEQTALKYAAAEIMRRGKNVIIALDPLDPDKYEAVAVPDCGVIFICPKWKCEQGRSIRLDSLPGSEQERFDRTEIRHSEKAANEMLNLAVSRLKKAKEIHDRIERIYQPHMDFNALNSYTNSVVEKI